MSDTFYGQWLVLHVPFHSPMDFIDEELFRKVPIAHRYFTAAMYCEDRVAVAVWTNDEAIEHELMIEGHTKRHSDSIMAMVRATRSLITDYVTGRLGAAEEEMRAAEEVQLAPEQIQETHLNFEQQCFDTMATKFLKTSLVVDQCQDEFDADRAREYLVKENRMLSLLCPSVTGETTVTHMLVEWLLFGFDEQVASGSWLAMYNLVVIEEISQLECWHYDRFAQLWLMAETHCDSATNGSSRLSET